MITKIALQKGEDELKDELEKKILDISTSSREKDYGALAKKLGLNFSNLKTAPIGIEALEIADEKELREAQSAIIYKAGTHLLVAVTDPQGSTTQKFLEKLKNQGYQVKIIITTPGGLETAWDKFKSFEKVEVFESGAITINEEKLENIQAQIKNLDDIKNKVETVSVTEVLEILIGGGLKVSASDIHFEPEKEHARIRYRLDGFLQDIASIKQHSYEQIVNRVKVLSKAKLNIHGSPQDGRFTVKQKNIEIEIRVSVLPSEYGETIVMRILDPRTIQLKLEDLGMRSDILDLVKEQLGKSTGAILTTGPTGSGKTTSLYAFIQHIHTSDLKIITIEDPIEYHIEGISQTQVETEKGYSFSNGLRAIVRQDPDVILVGEIRDKETADIALQAALTGHLVLSTIHTNDAAGTVPRLVDLGVKANTVSSALTLAMAQRLLRKLCDCKISNENKTNLESIKKTLENLRKKIPNLKITDNLKMYEPGKCDKCNGVGYKGRIGVYEAFTITKEMENLILENKSVSDIREQAIKDGMITMLEDAYLKVANGETSLTEIERVLGN